jgi:hypothetical protein
VLNLTQDRCTVCAERTIGSEIVLGPPDGTRRFEAQVEAHFSRLEIVLILTQDRCTVLAKSTIGLEIILDVPD